MKFSNAVKKLEKEGFSISSEFNYITATKQGHKVIEVHRNGREDQVAVISVGVSYPSSLKRALQLSQI